MKNPFQYGGIVSGPFFADRSDEIRELGREMGNNSRVFLVSQRRFGKTCLLHHLKATLESQGTACAYIDVNAYPDLRGFAEAITNLATRALESNTDRLLKLFSGLRRLRPKLSVDRDGNISTGLELAVPEKEALDALVEGLSHISALAEKKKKKMVMVIDEFSDIEKYNGGTVEKALRSEVQKHGHIGFIFSGSEQSVMMAMIQDRNRAFYKLGRLMRLGPIKRDAYARFIFGWLQQGGYTVSADGIERIFEIGKDVPYNIQRLCHAIWEAALETRTIGAELIEAAPIIIARQDSAHYEMVWQTATRAQQILLIALADEPEARPFSKAFQLQYGVGPSSSINASLSSLVKKGLLYKTVEGEYCFTDSFMPFWIKDMRG